MSGDVTKDCLVGVCTRYGYIHIDSMHSFRVHEYAPYLGSPDKYGPAESTFGTWFCHTITSGAGAEDGGTSTSSTESPNAASSAAASASLSKLTESGEVFLSSIFTSKKLIMFLNPTPIVVCAEGCGVMALGMRTRDVMGMVFAIAKSSYSLLLCVCVVVHKDCFSTINQLQS